MGKAFRSDSVGLPDIAAEIARLRERADALPADTIKCPIEGCEVRYSMYNYLFSDRDANLNCLLYGLKIHHPTHPVRFVLNEQVLSGYLHREKR